MHKLGDMHWGVLHFDSIVVEITLIRQVLHD